MAMATVATDSVVMATAGGDTTTVTAGVIMASTVAMAAACVAIPGGAGAFAGNSPDAPRVLDNIQLQGAAMRLPLRKQRDASNQMKLFALQGAVYDNVRPPARSEVALDLGRIVPCLKPLEECHGVGLIVGHVTFEKVVENTCLGTFEMPEFEA